MSARPPPGPPRPPAPRTRHALRVGYALRQSTERAKNLAAWAARALPGLPARVRDHDVARGLALAATKLVAAPRSFERAAPSRATLQLVEPFVRPEGRIAVAVRRTAGALELRRGGVEAGWHGFDVPVPPIIYVGGRGVAVPLDGVARIATPGDDVELRDIEGRGWRLEPQQDGQEIRPGLARLETGMGVGVAYLLGADVPIGATGRFAGAQVAATSGSLVHQDVEFILEFPGLRTRARVAVMGAQRRGAILRLDTPLRSYNWLRLDTSPRVGTTWRVFPPEPTPGPAVMMGTVLEVTSEYLRLAPGELKNRDLLGAPVIVDGRVVGHVSGESTTSGIVARSATVVEALLKRLAEGGDRGAERRQWPGAEYLIVRFSESRQVLIDGVPQGLTNVMLQLEVGRHEVTLAPPKNFTPLSQTVLVQNTAALEPKVVEFRPASSSGASASRESEPPRAASPEPRQASRRRPPNRGASRRKKK